MQSRLSSATTTTDFSIVTDSTVTVDVDDSEFVGLKKGKELGHGSYGTVHIQLFTLKTFAVGHFCAMLAKFRTQIESSQP